MVFVTKLFEVVQNCVREGFREGPQLLLVAPVLAGPYLNYFVSHLAKKFCSPLGVLKEFFECFLADNRVEVGVTFRATVVMAAVILENGF